LALTQLALRVHLLSSISRAETVREIDRRAFDCCPRDPARRGPLKEEPARPRDAAALPPRSPWRGEGSGRGIGTRSIGVYGLRPALWAVDAKWFLLSFVERRLRRRAHEVAEEVVRIRSLAFPCQENARRPHFPRNISRDVS
jgi:hypothetical protein